LSYYNKIQELAEKDRENFIAEKRAEYDSELDIMRGASEFFIDAVGPGDRLRTELIERFSIASRKVAVPVRRRSMVIPG
jgi:acetyl-CoA carboxylase carboxyltransferase component